MEQKKHDMADELKNSIRTIKSEIKSIEKSAILADSKTNYVYIGSWNNNVKIPKEHQKTFITLIDSVLKEQLKNLEKEYEEL